MSINAPNHWLFQLANGFFLISYLTFDILFLRIELALAALCLGLWGFLILDISLDTTLWNTSFFIINLLQAARIVYSKRPIKFSDERHEVIYKELFEPVGVKRRDFKQLADVALMRSLKAGSLYIEEGNEAHNLSLLQKGTVDILKRVVSSDDPSKIVDIKLNSAKPMEFIESPEFAARIAAMRNRGQKTIPPRRRGLWTWLLDKVGDALGIQRHQYGGVSSENQVIPSDVEEGAEEWVDRVTPTIVGVSVKATTDCVFMTWPAETLMKLLNKIPQLKAPFGSVVGADVARKLFRQTGLHKKRFSQFKQAGILGGTLNLPTEPYELTSSDLDVYKALVARVDIEITLEDATRLFQLGKLRKIRREGTKVIHEGEEVTFLGLLYDGSMAIAKGEEALFTVERLDFIGSFEYLDKENSGIAKYTMMACEPCTYLEWDVQDLQKFLRQKPQLHAAMTALVALDISKKFQHLGDTPPKSIEHPLSPERKKKKKQKPDAK